MDGSGLPFQISPETFLINTNFSRGNRSSSSSRTKVRIMVDDSGESSKRESNPAVHGFNVNEAPFLIVPIFLTHNQCERAANAVNLQIGVKKRSH